MKEFLIEYFKKTGYKRFLVMVLGNVFVALGVALFRMIGMGTDPFNGMNMSVSEWMPMSYPTWQALLNIGLLVVVFFANKHYIGIGTVVNGLLCGYIISMFIHLMIPIDFAGMSIPMKIVMLIVAVLIISLGLSLYQKSDVGCGPYDALPIIMNKQWIKKVPYFWCRMMLDGACALICFLSGGVLGVGTLLTVFCLGPFISFFNRFVTKPVFHLE